MIFVFYSIFFDSSEIKREQRGIGPGTDIVIYTDTGKLIFNRTTAILFLT